MYSDKACSTNDLSEFLSELDLSQHLSKFKDHGYDKMQLLDAMDDDELKDMFSEVGLPGGHKLQIKKALKNRNEKTKTSRSSVSSQPDAFDPYIEEVKEQKVAFGKYASVRVLGSGNFGEAHLVADSSGQNKVLKTLVCENID